MYMHEGEVVERGGGGVGGGEMMVRPTSAPAREYVSAFRSMLKDPVRPQLLSDRLLVLRSLSLVRVTGGHDWRGASRGDEEAAEAAEQGQSMSNPARSAASFLALLRYHIVLKISFVSSSEEGEDQRMSH